jgi:hypothetical protein
VLPRRRREGQEGDPSDDVGGGSLAERLSKHDRFAGKYYSLTAEANLIVMNNVKPKWNEAMGAYTLNFYDRVKVASKKNFQLVRPRDGQFFSLIFDVLHKYLYLQHFFYNKKQ